jgi:hypothetical protein
MGSWVDSPSSLGLENLHKRLEKIDLGRRSDLNFSSQQSAIQKYDQDFTRTEDIKSHRRNDPDEVDDDAPDYNALYRDGSKEDRQHLWDTRPWQQPMWEATYGRP